jgi:hypothetical protein
MTRQGRAEMRNELKEDEETFHNLDRDISAVRVETIKQLGIDEKRLDAHKRDITAKIEAGLPWDG